MMNGLWDGEVVVLVFLSSVYSKNRMVTYTVMTAGS